MREIKFRAWDGKKMIYCGHVQPMFNMASLIGCAATLVDTEYMDDFSISSGENIVLMQFTGLKDAKGKEIFEGDVVKCLDGYSATVSWDDKHAGWDPFGSYEGAEWDKSVEIIGNIYENPELLK